MKKHFYLLSTLIIILALTACQGAAQGPAQTPTPAATETAAPPANTNTPAPSLTPSLTLEPTATFAPTWTPTATQPPTPTPPTYVREGNTIPVPDEAITAENADQIVELARLGKGAIQEVQLSPNRLMLIVRTTIGVYGYDADTLEEIWSWEDPSGIAAMAVPRLARWIAVATNDGRVAMLVYARGSMFTQMLTGYNKITGLAFSYDDDMVAAIGDQGVTIWQVGETEPLYKYPEMVNSAVHFTPGDENIITSSVSGFMYFYALQSGELQNEISLDFYELISFSPDGNYISNGRSVWDGTTGEILFNLERSTESEYGFVTFSYNSQYLALNEAYAESLTIWQLSNGEKFLELKSPFNEFGGNRSLNKLAAPIKRSGGYFPYYLDMAFSPDGQQFAATTSNDTVEVWNFGSGKFVQQISCNGDALIYRKNSRLVIWGAGALQQVDPNYGITINLTRGFSSLRYTNQYFVYDENNERTVNFSPSGEWLFVDNIVWHIPDGKRSFRLGEELVLAVSPNNDTIYTFDNADDTVRTRQIGNFEIIDEVILAPPEHTDYSFSPSDYTYRIEVPAMSPTGNYFVGNIYDFGLYVWDLQTGESIMDLFHNGSILNGAFSSDGQHLAVGEYQRLSIIDLSNKESGSEKEGNYADVWSCINFSNDNHYIITIQRGMEKITLEENFSIIDSQKIVDTPYGYEITISPTNELIAVGNDNNIAIFDFETGELIARIPAHFKNIAALAFSPDGKYLATSSYDGTVKLWGIPPGE